MGHRYWVPAKDMRGSSLRFENLRYATTVKMGVTDSDIPRICDEQLSFYIGKHNMSAKQAAFIMLGMFVSGVLFMLLCVSIIGESIKFFHTEAFEEMLPMFLIIIIISLLAGGIVTGFLSYPLLETKWGMLWIAPGLYIVILTSFSYLMVSLFELLILFSFLPLYLCCYLISLAGVGLGYFLRALIRRLCKSD